MATLEHYDFRQQRRQSPDLKKSKDEAFKIDTSTSAQIGRRLCVNVDNRMYFHSLHTCTPLYAGHTSLEDDIRELKIFDLDYTYGPTVGKGLA